MQSSYFIRLFVFINALMCICITSGFSQPVIVALPRWMVTGTLDYSIPQAPSKRFMDHNHPGFSVEAQYRIQYNKPFLAGLFYKESILSRYVLEYPSGDIDIKEKANTRKIEGGITASFYPEINWLLQPYLTGRIGLAVFQTSSILTDSDTQESLERISESTTSAPTYGLDIGVHIVPNIWYIRGDIRVGFVGNTSTDYLLLDKANEGTTGFPIDYFKQYTASGKWLKISAGLSFLF